MKFVEAANAAQKYADYLREMNNKKETWVELSFAGQKTGIWISNKSEVSASEFVIDTVSKEWDFIK